MRFIALLGLALAGIALLSGAYSQLVPRSEAEAAAARATPAPTAVPKAGTQTVAAFSLCKDVVMPPRLKAPATAHFASITDSSIAYTPTGDAYLVESYVDSQNGFGAQIRTSFSCLVSPRVGTQWAVLNLTTTP